MGFAYSSISAPLPSFTPEQQAQQKKAAEEAQSLLESKLKEGRVYDDATNLKNYSDKSNVDLTNQQKAWEAASKFKQSDAAQQIQAQTNLADQSNVAQKDRLVSQLTNQKDIQQAEFKQTNQLRDGDSQRAANAYKMNF